MRVDLSVKANGRLSVTYPVGREGGEAGLSIVTSTFSAGLGSTSEGVAGFLARAISHQLLCWRFLHADDVRTLTSSKADLLASRSIS